MRFRNYVALIPVCVGVFIAADDQTVLVTILPQIMVDMKVPISELHNASWTITGYMLGYLSVMPLIGQLSDSLGHRRLFITAMITFMMGSVGAALTQDLSWLIAIRIFQAMGAGALVPIAIAITGDLFPKGKRSLPLGLIIASAEAGSVIGPLWGGMILKHLDWRWVFWINIPLGILVLTVLVFLISPSPRYRVRVDYYGGGLIALALVLLTLGLSRIGTPDPLMIVYIGLAGTALLLFVHRERRFAVPLFPTSMFHSWTFKAANITHLLIGSALIIGIVTIPLMANTVLALSPLEGGLRLMRLTAAIPLGAVLSSILCRHVDCRIPTFIGLLLSAIGYLLMSSWGTETADPGLTLHLIVTGFGFGLLIVPIALAGTESVGEENRGAAASIVTAMRILGMTLGLATITAWGNVRFQILASDLTLPIENPGETTIQTENFNSALNNVGMTLFSEFFLIASCICLLGLLPTLLMAWNRNH